MTLWKLITNSFIHKIKKSLTHSFTHSIIGKVERWKCGKGEYGNSFLNPPSAIQKAGVIFDTPLIS